MRALLVCHAGSGIGLGHLSRMLVIARLLREELGFEIQIVVQGEDIDRPDLLRYRHTFVPLTNDLSVILLQIWGEKDITIVVFDLHPQHIPEDIERLVYQFHSGGAKVVGIDGLASFSNVLDLIYIPSFQYDLPEGADKNKFYYGWDAYLLNCSFDPISWKPGNSLLVLTGGSDTTGLGEHLPAQLEKRLPLHVEVKWVVGPYATTPVLPEYIHHVFNLHYAPSHLDELMLHSNYAITVFGVSFFELLYYGIPTVVFSPYGLKDRCELQGIAEAGVAVVADDEHDAVTKLKELLHNPERSARVSKNALQVMRQAKPHAFVRLVQQLLNT